MALRSLHRMRPVVLEQMANPAATISYMRTLIADMRETADRTTAVIDMTRATLAAADDLLMRSITRAPQRR